MADDLKPNPGATAPPQLVCFDEAGHVVVDWPLAERFAQAWELGVRDHPGVLWAKILVAVREQIARVDKAIMEKLIASPGAGSTARLREGPPPKIVDNNAWKPAAWEQLSRAVEELKDPQVIGMAVVLMRLADDARGLESLPMWSAAVDAPFIHSALAMAAEDIAAGFRSEGGVRGQPVRPLN
jgi:hypothetical protein